jgi:hypothetical protein
MLNANYAVQEMAMTDARPQLVFEASISRTAAAVAAGLLVFTGVVLQLCELGLGHQTASGFWFIQMILVSVWRLLALHLNMPAIADALRFWPLLLVGFGLAILAALKPKSARE